MLSSTVIKENLKNVELFIYYDRSLCVMHRKIESNGKNGHHLPVALCTATATKYTSVYCGSYQSYSVFEQKKSVRAQSSLQYLFFIQHRHVLVVSSGGQTPSLYSDVPNVPGFIQIKYFKVIGMLMTIHYSIRICRLQWRIFRVYGMYSLYIYRHRKCVV